MENQYMSQKKKNLSKILISWVVSDPTQAWPAHFEGQAVAGETPFST